MRRHLLEALEYMLHQEAERARRLIEPPVIFINLALHDEVMRRHREREPQLEFFWTDGDQVRIGGAEAIVPPGPQVVFLGFDEASGIDATAVALRDMERGQWEGMRFIRSARPLPVVPVRAESIEDRKARLQRLANGGRKGRWNR